MPNRTCSLDGCDAVHYAKGWCVHHYGRVRQTGSPDGNPHAPFAVRFWSRVDRSGPCWLWVGARGHGGYGVTAWPDGRTARAHRVAYTLCIGPIPDGLVLDHLCRIAACVNPMHLEPVSVRENTIRGVGPSALNAGKTHCSRGHEFTAESTYTYQPSGRRLCRICEADGQRIRRAKAKAALTAVVEWASTGRGDDGVCV